MARTMRRLVLLMLLPLAACAAEPEPNAADALDAELAEGVASGGDPMARAALADPIMSDPMLTTRANIDTIRPPAQPYAAPIPAPDIAPAPDDAPATPDAPAPGDCPECQAFHDSLTLAALAARQPRGLVGACGTALAYGAGWASRLPRDLPMPPDARVIEAAGNDAGGCRLRIARFVTRQAPDAVVDWYYARARAAGYAPDHHADDQDLHLVTGRRGRQEGRVFVAPGDNGATVVTLLSNAGA